MTALEHLQAALAILEPQRDAAKNRYELCEEKARKYRRNGNAKMRQAWYEYRAIGEMIDGITAALEAAKLLN